VVTISPIGMRRHKNNDFFGFTLIEMILVIVFLGVIAGISAPLFKNTYSEFSLEDYAYQLESTLRYAQQMAIIDRVNYRLKIDPEKYTYWIEKVVQKEEGEIYQKISSRFGRCVTLPDGLSLSSGNSEIVFYPDGQSTRTEIFIMDKDGAGVRCVVKGLSSESMLETVSK